MVKYNIIVRATIVALEDYSDIKVAIDSALVGTEVNAVNFDSTDTINKIYINVTTNSLTKANTLKNGAKTKLDTMVTNGKCTAYEIRAMEIATLEEIIRYPEVI